MIGNLSTYSLVLFESYVFLLDRKERKWDAYHLSIFAVFKLLISIFFESFVDMSSDCAMNENESD